MEMAHLRSKVSRAKWASSGGGGGRNGDFEVTML